MKKFSNADIQDIYFLSPMQENILFDSLLDTVNNTFVTQSCFSINGALDVELLEKSFNLLIKKYDVFRTIFIYEKVERPLQAVLKDYETSIYFEDISHLDEPQKKRMDQ